jgi:hypothetical protein
LNKLPVKRLFDFSPTPTHWKLLDLSVDWNGHVTFLVRAQDPEQTDAKPSDVTGRLPFDFLHHQVWSMDPAVPFSATVELDIPDCSTGYRFARRFGTSDWLLVSRWDESSRPFFGSPPVDAYLVDGSLDLQKVYTLGATKDIQVSTAGTIWTAVEQTGLGHGVLKRGLLEFDRDGRTQFVLGANADGDPWMPEWYSFRHLNVGIREIWFSYLGYTERTFEGLETFFGVVLDGVVEGPWQWSTVAREASQPLRAQFAVAGELIIAQGCVPIPRYSQECHELELPRIFAMTMSGMRARDYLPVDEDDRPIGHFCSIARGSRLYLVTKSAIFMFDGNELT